MHEVGFSQRHSYNGNHPGQGIYLKEAEQTSQTEALHRGLVLPVNAIALVGQVTRGKKNNQAVDEDGLLHFTLRSAASLL